MWSCLTVIKEDGVCRHNFNRICSSGVCKVNIVIEGLANRVDLPLQATTATTFPAKIVIKIFCSYACI